MKLINPYTGKPVEAVGEAVDRLRSAGFKPVESTVQRRKPGRPKKSE